MRASFHLRWWFETPSVVVHYLPTICPLHVQSMTEHIPNIYRTYTGHILNKNACKTLVTVWEKRGKIMPAAVSMSTKDRVFSNTAVCISTYVSDETYLKK